MRARAFPEIRKVQAAAWGGVGRASIWSSTTSTWLPRATKRLCV